MKTITTDGSTRVKLAGKNDWHRIVGKTEMGLLVSDKGKWIHPTSVVKVYRMTVPTD